MIEIIKEKTYFSKDPKFRANKSSILFDTGRGFKFTASTTDPTSGNSEEFGLFVGNSNGFIFKINLKMYKSEHF